MVEVGLGVLMFTLVIVSLVVVLMLARRQLVAAGEVTIVINDDPAKALRTTAGRTLLDTLGIQLDHLLFRTKPQSIFHIKFTYKLKKTWEMITNLCHQLKLLKKCMN